MVAGRRSGFHGSRRDGRRLVPFPHVALALMQFGQPHQTASATRAARRNVNVSASVETKAILRDYSTTRATARPAVVARPAGLTEFTAAASRVWKCINSVAPFSHAPGGEIYEFSPI